MRGVNRVMLVGRLGRDVEVAYRKDGTAVASLSLATTEVWDGADGKRRERTEWHRVVCVEKLAALVAKLAKGAALYVEGRLQTRSFEQDGTKRAVVEVHAREVQLIGAGDASRDPLGEVARHSPRKRYSTAEPEPEGEFQATAEDVPF